MIFNSQDAPVPYAIEMLCTPFSKAVSLTPSILSQKKRKKEISVMPRNPSIKVRYGLT